MCSSFCRVHRKVRVSNSHAYSVVFVKERVSVVFCATYTRSRQRKSPSDQQCGNGERLRATLCESRTTRALETTYLYRRCFVHDRFAARTFPNVEIGRPSSNVLSSYHPLLFPMRASFVNRLTAIRIAPFFRV